ncbi:MAG: hypothetical protein LJE69_01005 [Thiohalocapsa sp.]|jgi:DamX protein|uniref:hypothetical protein n=1 Tax=Thiohalocapsa sp. TaxID=2497641 RepID=UPI0025F660AD|nr:hypothetical protein [Thiohalocapsa sp.]MCG6939817.1 hypothetical protein [Thiohalocapsa sp.]
MSDSPEQEKSNRARGSDPDLAGYLHKESPRAAGKPDSMTTLPTPDDPPPATANMRDMEKSLVERIADVDDDRRRSAVQMRKALETHREEMRAQRRRDHTAILVLTGIGIILLAAVLLLFSEMVKTRNAFEARVAALEHKQPAAPGTASADIQAEIDQLGDAVEAIGDRLTALEGAGQRVASASTTGSGTAASAAPGAGPSTAPPTASPGASPAAPPAAPGQSAAVDARVAALLDERLASLEARIDELRAERQAAAAGAKTTSAGKATASASVGEAASAAKPGEAGSSTNTLTTGKNMVALQLVGLPSHEDIERFIARHDLPGKIYLKVDSLRGRPWYGLIYGMYPDMAAAEAARKALPPDLARLDIWLRELPAGTPLEILKGQR